ncbi:uncharacterized protein LOC131623075 [Vicia villosa]|uniref:uncharacterized protein LOC131623075 n=1 Tax=Vicia villosa TaxID=3911 RepID=UPI00273B9DBD|nr:uncharacterized protein LOC131623075 [Vicia villosa]
MKLLSWNYRGLGSPRAVRSLMRLIRIENPDVLFLMETRLNSSEIQNIRSRSSYEGGFSVDCNGEGRHKAGVLTLLWKDAIHLMIKSFSLNHIEGSILDECDSQKGDFGGIYGFPKEKNKKRTWALIQWLVNQGRGKFVCFGDLNDILSESEKQGGNSRTAGQLLEGRNTMDMCGLSDLGFEGYPFTWTNGRKDMENIQIRLDRCLAKEEFVNRFSPIKVSHLGRFGSDHAAIRIQLEVDSSVATRKKCHMFRFEEVWSRDPACIGLVKKPWNKGHPSII